MKVLHELVVEPNMPLNALSKRIDELVERYGGSLTLSNGRSVLKFARYNVPEAEEDAGPTDPKDQPSMKATTPEDMAPTMPETAKVPNGTEKPGE